MNDVEGQGAKEVAHAALIAAISALAGGLVAWALEEAKQKYRARTKSESKGETP